LRLAFYLRQKHFQVVHTHDLYSNLVGVPAAWLAQTPLIISSRRDLSHWSWYTPFRRAVLRRLQRLSDYILVNSEAVCQSLLSENGFSTERIRVVRNGVDFDRFSTAKGIREALFPNFTRNNRLVAVVGNMHILVKGHLDLIEAAQEILKVSPQVRFILIGDGAQRPVIEKKVRELGLEQNFLLLGYRMDVPELLSCCDLFVLPSVAEGLPNAVLEAMAAGLPVVTTRVGGVPEIIEDGVTGLLVPPKDPRALAEAISRVLRNPELAARIAHAGQEHVRSEFSFDRLIENLNRLYTTTLC